MRKTIAETISDAAKREGANRSEIQRSKAYGEYRERVSQVGASQNIFVPGKVYNYIVDLNDFPITLNDFRGLVRDSIRVTHGFYTLQYIPSGFPKRNPKFPYLIGQDLVRIRVTTSGPKHWECLCSRIPELDWINRNTTICRELFGIAKKHPGLVLRFGIDFVKYCDKITNRASELGIDIDNKPLVVYQWASDKVPDVEAIIPQRDKKYYADILRTVQEESKGEENIE